MSTSGNRPDSLVDAFCQSATSEPFWAGLEQGELLLPYCDECQRAFFYPRRWCPRCWSSSISWQQATGRGVLYSLCVVHTAFEGVDPDELPYSVGLVDLEEGVRIPALLGPGETALRVGDRVEATFPVGGGLPTFQPATF